MGSIEGEVVSRKDLFAYDDEPEDPSSNYVPDLCVFEEVEVSGEPHEDNADPGILDFQLFGGEGMGTIDLVHIPEEKSASRPASYYMFKPSSQQMASFEITAISGLKVVEEADFWKKLARKRGPAPDINAGYVAPKKRCRPGASARRNKKLRNERKAALEKERMQQMRFQRRNKKFSRPPARR